jgi:hypothetical protein
MLIKKPGAFLQNAQFGGMYDIQFVKGVNGMKKNEVKIIATHAKKDFIGIEGKSVSSLLQSVISAMGGEKADNAGREINAKYRLQYLENGHTASPVTGYIGLLSLFLTIFTLIINSIATLPVFVFAAFLLGLVSIVLFCVLIIFSENTKARKDKEEILYLNFLLECIGKAGAKAGEK